MVKRLLAILLIVLAWIPFTAPFAAYDVNGPFDASSSAVWHQAGSTSIDVESCARVDTVFPNTHTGCPAIVCVAAPCVMTLITTEAGRPRGSHSNGALPILSPTLRI